MVQHLRVCVDMPKGWCLVEGKGDFAHVVSMAPFSFRQLTAPPLLAMVSMGWSVKVLPLLWPGVGCGPGYTVQNLNLGLEHEDGT